MRKTLLLCGIALLTVASAFAAPVQAASAAYSFNLTGPNTAVSVPGAPFEGDTIKLRGSGTFDPATGAVDASGAFTHVHPDGSVVARGTWVSTAFVSFTAFGGPSDGKQGGVLWITVDVIHEGQTVFADLPMSVTCLVNAPSDFTGEEGTTLGPFLEETGGQTLFHRQ